MSSGGVLNWATATSAQSASASGTPARTGTPQAALELSSSKAAIAALYAVKKRYATIITKRNRLYR